MVITPRIHLTLAECNLILEALRALPAHRQDHVPFTRDEITGLQVLFEYLDAAFTHAMET